MNPSKLWRGSTTSRWRSLLDILLLAGEEVRPRDRLTKELVGFQSVIDMNSPIVTCPKRELGYKFMAAEAAWILSGDNRVMSIRPFSRRISEFSDDGLTFFGAYGPKFIEQSSYVVDCLLQDPVSRQAVATIWRERPRQTKDVPCTVALQWLYRAEKLHCVATMRSSDLWLGWPYDVFNFSMMSAYILLALQYRQGKLDAGVNWLDVSLGTLQLTAGSQHLYSVDYERARACAECGEDGIEYAPINLVEFLHPQVLPDHLWSVATNAPLPAAISTWLKEFRG